MSLCMIDAHVHSSSQSERLSQLNRLFEEVDERRKVMHKIIHTFYTRQKFFWSSWGCAWVSNTAYTDNFIEHTLSAKAASYTGMD